MVTISRISADPLGTQWALPGDRKFAAGGHLTFDGTPRASTWNPPKFYIQNPLKLRANFFILTPGALAFDEAVRSDSTIGMFLEMSGEILPITLESGEPLFVLNVTECVNALDQEKTVFRVDPMTKVRTGVVQYAFHEERLTQSPIFKIPETRRAEILTFSGRFKGAEDEFVSMCEQSKLTGLKFEQIWEGNF